MAYLGRARFSAMGAFVLVACTYSLDPVEDTASTQMGTAGASASGSGGGLSAGKAGAPTQAGGGQSGQTSAGQSGQTSAGQSGQTSVGQSGQTSAGQSGHAGATQAGAAGKPTGGAGGTSAGAGGGVAGSGGASAGGAVTAGAGGADLAGNGSGGDGGAGGASAGAGGAGAGGAAAGAGGSPVVCTVSTAPACDTSAVDVTGTDKHNCGTCNRSCGTFEACTAGVCAPELVMDTGGSCGIDQFAIAQGFTQGAAGELIYANVKGDELTHVCKYYASEAPAQLLLSHAATAPAHPAATEGPGVYATAIGGGFAASYVQWAYTDNEPDSIDIYKIDGSLPTAPYQSAPLRAAGWGAKSWESSAPLGTNADLGSAYQSDAGQETRAVAISPLYVFVWDLGASLTRTQQFVRRMQLDGSASTLDDFFGPVHDVSRIAVQGNDMVYALARLVSTDPWIIYGFAQDAPPGRTPGSAGVTTIALDDAATEIWYPTSMIATDDALYIADAGPSKGTMNDGKIVRYDTRAGCTGATVVANGLFRPFGLTADDTFVAWADHAAAVNPLDKSTTYEIRRAYQDGTGQLVLYTMDPTWSRNTLFDEIEVGLGHDGAGNVYFAPGSNVTYNPSQPFLPSATTASNTFGNLFRIPL